MEAPRPAPASERASEATPLHLDLLMPVGLGVLVVVAAVGFAVAVAARAGAPILITTAISAVLFTAALLAVLHVLVRRSLVTPLSELRGALQEVEVGNYDARLEPSGVRETFELGEVFNRMATIVGHQRDRLKALAATDPLTGLANHRHFHERLRAELLRAERGGGAVAVVALDLDHFKAVNDMHGHGRGDEALKSAGEALRNAVRGSDLVARLGGDDFMILLPGADGGYAREVAERAREALLNRSSLVSSVSAGFACFPTHANADTSLEELAISALNVAKKSGGNQTKKFDVDQAATLPTLREQRAQVLALLERRKPITPVFQPLVELATGRIGGYEALARFNDDSGRPPDAWFNQATRCGLGARLEAEAIRAALECPDRPAGTYLSLNFSPSALTSRRVRAVLPRDLSDVVIEITEHELAAEDGSLQASLAGLRQRGARIAVDDAGAGYAGLQQVMHVQPDIIKLDRALIERVDMDSAKAALVEFFVLFAQRVGATVCTEGIETVAELAALVDLNVAYGQGYLLARPAEKWPGVAPDVGKALAVGSLRGHGRLARPEHVTGPVNRRLERGQGAPPRRERMVRQRSA
ncbi:MAG: sensor domain-containing phosphodiesterase [Actinomycetota bacterium]|nr:sensor domain-containing phosphodiesterase [Actinomycetota bacterium]